MIKITSKPRGLANWVGKVRLSFKFERATALSERYASGSTGSRVHSIMDSKIQLFFEFRNSKRFIRSGWQRKCFWNVTEIISVKTVKSLVTELNSAKLHSPDGRTVSLNFRVFGGNRWSLERESLDRLFAFGPLKFSGTCPGKSTFECKFRLPTTWIEFAANRHAGSFSVYISTKSLLGVE